MGGKIGVLVDVATDVVNADIEEMAKNVCMQVAALNPKYTDRSEVDQDYLAKEEEILTAAAKNEKPDANDKIITGMVKGRLNKELKEICIHTFLAISSIASFTTSVTTSTKTPIFPPICV